MAADPYDAIYGNIANDDVATIVNHYIRLLRMGRISPNAKLFYLEQLQYSEPNNQYCIATQKGIDALKFKGSYKSGGIKMFDDTALMRMVIEDLAKKKNGHTKRPWKYFIIPPHARESPMRKPECSHSRRRKSLNCSKKRRVCKAKTMCNQSHEKNCLFWREHLWQNTKYFSAHTRKVPERGCYTANLTRIQAKYA
jgi:hypothetical protein